MWVGVCVSVCVHNAGSADSSLHRLLVCTTALLSSLISSVNVSLWLIENELVYVSPQCLNKAVKETHTLSLQEKHQNPPTVCKE